MAGGIGAAGAAAPPSDPVPHAAAATATSGSAAAGRAGQKGLLPARPGWGLAGGGKSASARARAVRQTPQRTRAPGAPGRRRTAPKGAAAVSGRPHPRPRRRRRKPLALLELAVGLRTPGGRAAAAVGGRGNFVDFCAQCPAGHSLLYRGRVARLRKSKRAWVWEARGTRWFCAFIRT